MASSRYIITEPAPSTNTYIRSGRGGFGNTHRIPAAAASPPPASAPASATNDGHRRSKPQHFFSGIGGAGNAHEAQRRPTVALDEEFVRRTASMEHAASIGHCGIGGAGNVFRRKESDASDRSLGSAASDTDSMGSSMRAKAKLLSRLSRTLSGG